MARRGSPFTRLRNAAGFTQEALAAELGVDRRTVGRWERGEVLPLPPVYPRLARVLDVSVKELTTVLAETARHAAGPDPSLLGGARAVRRLPTGSADHLDEVVAHLREQWHVLVQADNLLGPRRALTGVLEQINVIEELLPVSRGPGRSELVKLAATYAESAAWLYEDAGRMPESVRWVDRAMSWSYEAGNRNMLAWTLFRKSQHAAANRDAGGTLGLASAARREAATGATPMWAAILQQQAHGHALAGDENLMNRMLEAAHASAASETSGDARQGHGSFCTPAYLELKRAQYFVVLGKPVRAVELFESVLPDLPPVYRRDRGVAVGRLAQAHLAMNHPDQAATLGREALAIARSVGSIRTEQEVSKLGRQLNRHKRIPAVRDLLDDLREAA
ncbi:helix-turn-helix transcriptional regulator [Kutzneria buriramensis]|uniref:DNA-binding XRE family transcriptional regulator n=1 Tax=Kutzneria buriramensis TaxID=1045776 RepID=A0A3E0GV49_9PSEU|nr:helix-turn-helix transcriptional regulator [Kutzneria buriramensis]REH28628.1 DNA-binding XRE family transcriptional regulator [Kutzneria buriramensis]